MNLDTGSRARVSGRRPCYPRLPSPRGRSVSSDWCWDRAGRTEGAQTRKIRAGRGECCLETGRAIPESSARGAGRSPRGRGAREGQGGVFLLRMTSLRGSLVL